MIKNKKLWVAYLDDIPTIGTQSHEVCDPEPLTPEDVERMWDALKKRCNRLSEALKKIADRECANEEECASLAEEAIKWPCSLRN